MLLQMCHTAKYAMRSFMTLVENLTPQIVPIEERDQSHIVQACVKTFTGKGMSDDMIASFILHTTHFGLSRKLMLGDKMIGFYLFNDDVSIVDAIRGCETYEDLEPYRTKRGLEGVTLVVLPEFRRLGYGNLLKDYPKTLGYDYIYGMQLFTLNNVGDWLKRRRLVAKCHDYWITLEDLS